mgnify:CR=1 FL=1
MDFLRPALLWGLLGISVPVVIHLLGRRRVRTVPIATLRFLERARARASAHLKLRRLLLLFARAAALGCLALLYAGPGCRHSGGPQGPATWVLLLDTSPSMAANRGGRVPLEEGRAALRAILGAANAGDRFAFATTREGDPGWHQGFSADLAAVRRRLDEAAVAFGPHRLGAAVETARALLEGVPGGRVALATDLQASAWPAPGAAGAGRAAAAPVALIDVGLDAPRNAWIAAIEEGEGAVRVGVGASGWPAAEAPRRTVHLALGDERRLTAFLEGHETVFRFEPPPGVYEGEVRLDPGGDLALDDRVAFVGRGRAATRVLLVNGDPWGFEIRDELFFVRRALVPGTRLAGTFQVREVRLGDLVPADLEEADAVLLANPGPLRPELVDAVRRRLEEGAGVVVTAGDRWSTSESAQGLEPILAAPLRDVVTIRPDDASRRPFEALDLAVLAGPAALFRDRSAGDLSGVRVERYWLPEARVGEGVDVWMRLENGAPLLVERQVGRGRTLLLGTTADRDGADLCLQPAFLPWLERVLLHAAGRLRPALPSWALAGYPLELPYDAPMAVDGPGGRLFWAPGERFVPPEPGVYRIRSGVTLLDAFAARIDPAESDLTRLAPEEVETRLGPGSGTAGAAAGAGPFLGRRDVSAWFAAALLGALAFESLLSGRWRRARGVGALGGET